MNFTKYKLKDICVKITDGSHYSPEACESGYPMFSVKDMGDYNFIYDDVKYISKSDFSLMLANDCVPQKDDILIAKDGSYLTRVFVCEETKNEAILSSIAIFRCNKEIVNPKFLAYLFKTPYVKNYTTKSCVSGSALPRIVLKAFSQLELFIPSLEEQKKIVSILSPLDRKISLNRSINAELERMAKEIYDYWFVQFEFPRSVSGESGLPELSRTDDGNGQSHFPDEHGRPYKSSGGAMVYNPVLKREVPEGWEVKSLKEIATFTNGLACQKFRPTDENKLPVIKIREMHGGFSADTEFVKSNIPEKVKVYNGDVLFSWSASLEVMLWAYGNGGLNQHIFKVTSNNGWPKSFYYYQLLSYVDIFKKMAEARKTTMGHITEEHLEQSRIIVPNSVALAEQLESKIAPIFDKIVATSEEITLLQNQRDELLPLLMTGQVKIK